MTSKYPESWKKSLVCPLPKVKLPTTPNDYRPISILPAVSKALERIVHKQLTDYLNEHSLLDTYQSGFRPNHSTSTALLKVTDDIREASDASKATVLTLLDFTKAFDSVNIDLLLQKLRNLQLSETTVAWFNSYLRHRQQCVISDNRSSSWRYVMSGVPQGSVLGPLLFTIYINDISTVIKHSRYHLYADDLQCYISARPDSINDAINKLNEDLHCITQWTKKFDLKLNPEKTQAIIMGHKRLLSSINECEVCPVKVNSTEIHYSSVVKNLGVYMDKHLDWSKQVASTCKKVFSIIHTLQHAKIFLSTSLRKTKVQTLVVSHFDYENVLLTELNSDLTKR